MNAKLHVQFTVAFFEWERTQTCGTRSATTGLQTRLRQNVAMDKVTVYVRPSETFKARFGWKCFHKSIKFIKGLLYGVIKPSVINRVPQVKELLSSDTRGEARDWAGPAQGRTLIPFEGDA